jgi:Tol biopolymer transport system component
MTVGMVYAPEWRDDQGCHPHLSFTPDGSQVIFTSNRTGAGGIYLTDWDGML